ncbi:QueT transporter family protein [Lactococcus termiticola]|uniref:Queuosine transporter QueT n=1 Tax=Lactococcus termiticola TaxID=2169526 RepID=A0A2R5HF66_9LACT|nr:QueT transporter family protein [Lactococcus termiticola]GBG96703.1 queuosine transporter QueT [Lactococcus termiticola]
MENTNSHFSVNGLVRGAIVCALYIIVTYLMASFNLAVGPIQFRLSEMFNFMAFYNKRYLWAVTLGVAISNVIVPGNLGLVDFLVGGGSTLIFLGLGVLITKRLEGKRILGGAVNLRFLVFSVFFAISMVTIAAELHFMLQLPFWITWATLAGGEFVSLIIGMFIIEQINRHIDLRQ